MFASTLPYCSIFLVHTKSQKNVAILKIHHNCNIRASLLLNVIVFKSLCFGFIFSYDRATRLYDRPCTYHIDTDLKACLMYSKTRPPLCRF